MYTGFTWPNCVGFCGIFSSHVEAVRRLMHRQKILLFFKLLQKYSEVILSAKLVSAFPNQACFVKTLRLGCETEIQGRVV